MNDEVKYVQFEKLEDIVKMMSASMRAPPLPQGSQRWTHLLSPSILGARKRDHILCESEGENGKEIHRP